jgi:hypothetical protein
LALLPACLERLLVLLTIPLLEETFFGLPILFPQKWHTIDTCWQDSLRRWKKNVKLFKLPKHDNLDSN